MGKRARNVFRIMMVIAYLYVSSMEKERKRVRKLESLSLLSVCRAVAAAAAVIADSDCVFLMLFLGIVALNMNAARGKCGTKETNKAKVPQ